MATVAPILLQTIKLMAIERAQKNAVFLLELIRPQNINIGIW
jgi:hypothetical protein